MPLRPSDVPANIVAELNTGSRETANLAEGLAIDMQTLLGNVAPDWAADVVWPEKKSFTASMACVGQTLATRSPDELERIMTHPSDTARGWACFAIGHLDRLTLSARLKRIKPLADDPHFGVREWAWLGMRQHVVDNIELAIAKLTPWTKHKSEYLRRFATEATRPRGVWCKHIATLKQSPEIAVELLEPLKADPSKYVQDSVANWLNDAGKTQPDWVRATCNRWLNESDKPETARIVKRATRNL